MCTKGGENICGLFIGDLVNEVENAFNVKGIGPNRYGLVGFARPNFPALAYAILVGGRLFGTPSELSTAVNVLVNTGPPPEDGYAAISFALNNYSFRPAAGRILILVTDEDRDEGNPGSPISHTGIISAMGANDAQLIGFLNVTISDGAIAIDNTYNGYQAEGGGVYVTTPGASFTAGFGNTLVHDSDEGYLDPVFERNGLVFDLFQAKTANTWENISLAHIIADSAVDALTE